MGDRIRRAQGPDDQMVWLQPRVWQCREGAGTGARDSLAEADPGQNHRFLRHAQRLPLVPQRYGEKEEEGVRSAGGKYEGRQWRA